MTDQPPPITKAELKKLSSEERERYWEGVWLKCDACNPYAPTADCWSCCGQGVFMRMQYSALVTDAVDRKESDVPEDWKMGDPL